MDLKDCEWFLKFDFEEIEALSGGIRAEEAVACKFFMTFKSES